MEIGEATRHDLEELSINDNEVFFADIRRIFVSISEDLLRTLPLHNDLLRHLKCLHPSMRQQETSHRSIMNIARSLPQLIVPDDIDRISAEWHVYQNETIPNDWFENENGYYPIDSYWKQVLAMRTNTGVEKFVGLGKLIKCALALSHGNADVERGFSENAFLLSDDRSLLSDASINGLRATRDAVKFFGDGQPHRVPFTKGLLESVRRAHSRYCIDLEKQRDASTTTAKRKNDDQPINHDLAIEKELHLYHEQDLLHKNLSNVQKMIDEGTERLAAAISKKNFDELETAHLLIEGGKKKLAMTNTQIMCNSNQLIQLRKKQKKSV